MGGLSELGGVRVGHLFADDQQQDVFPRAPALCQPVAQCQFQGFDDLDQLCGPHASQSVNRVSVEILRKCLWKFIRNRKSTRCSMSITAPCRRLSISWGRARATAMSVS